MPLAELPHRATEQARRARSRSAPRVTSEPTLRRADTGLADVVLGWGRRSGVRRYWSEQAEGVAQGHVEVFGQRWPSTRDGTPDWDLDPSSGHRWPQDYCFDVPLSVPGAPDAEVKRVWELNRLVYLLPVAAEARVTDDPALRVLCRRHLRSWIESHPPRLGVTWRSGIELSIRMLAMVVVLELVSGGQASGDALEDDLESLVARSVAEQSAWVQRFPSRHSSSNNHRVAELAGLLVAQAAYPGLSTRSVVDAWWTELDAVLLAQFHEDGVPVEQAVMYGLLVLEWAGICGRLSRPRGHARPAPLDRRLERAVSFLRDVIDAEGHPVVIGDADDSALLTAALQPRDLALGILDLAATTLRTSADAPGPGPRTYGQGGYTTHREGRGAREVLWVLDHAPLGMGWLAAHAHADTLSVYLHVGGRPVLVDAGTYLYHAGLHQSGEPWRDRLRSTAEHNTVELDRTGSSLMAGPFSWRRSPRATGRLVSTGTTQDGWSVEAVHAGYADRLGVLHRRRLVACADGSYALHDTLEGRTGVAFRWSLLVAPGHEVERTADGWVVRHDGLDVLGLRVPERWRPQVNEEPAWCSLAFGRIEPTTRLVITGTTSASTAVVVGIDVVTAGVESRRRGAPEAAPLERPVRRRDPVVVATRRS